MEVKLRKMVCLYVYIWVKQSHYRPGQAQSVPEG